MSDSAETDIRASRKALCVSDSAESDTQSAFRDARMSVSAESDIQASVCGFHMSVFPESDTRGWYEKRVAEGTVPYEVVRPSVTLITRYSVIANGRLRCALAARTTRLLTAALPASSPRSKLVELPLSLPAPVRLCPHLPAPARQPAPRCFVREWVADFVATDVATEGRRL